MLDEVLSLVAGWSEGLACADGVRVTAAFDGLADALHRALEGLAPHAWDELVLSLRSSELLPILLQDPLTRWSYHRPHGHPGDAVLIDLATAQGDAARRLRETPARGRRIYAALQSRPLCAALRHRQRIAEGFLQSIAASCSAPSLLVVGAGHLRELPADAAHCWGRIVALDHDGAALDALAARLPQVEPMRLTARDGLPARLEGQVFDAAYAPGPCDYLAEAAARRLLARLAVHLHCGGRLMVCNFSPETADRGYREAFMDWKLIGRDEDDMMRLAAHAHPGCAARAWREPSGQVVFLEMSKQG